MVSSAGVARQSLLVHAQRAGRMIHDDHTMIAEREADNLLSEVAAILKRLKP